VIQHDCAVTITETIHCGFIYSASRIPPRSTNPAMKEANEQIKLTIVVYCFSIVFHCALIVFSMFCMFCFVLFSFVFFFLFYVLLISIVFSIVFYWFLLLFYNVLFFDVFVAFLFFSNVFVLLFFCLLLFSIVFFCFLLLSFISCLFFIVFHCVSIVFCIVFYCFCIVLYCFLIVLFCFPWKRRSAERRFKPFMWRAKGGSLFEMQKHKKINIKVVGGTIVSAGNRNRKENEGREWKR
jgi:hypothetical protein